MPAEFPPVERRIPLALQISDRIRDRIESGEWALGQRIPGEHELAEGLGASRNTVREAIRSLVHAGLLDARPGDGTYVSAGTELEVALQRRADREDATDVFEVREALERFGARRAAERRDPEQLERMRQLLAERNRSATVHEYTSHDLAFHLELVRASGNRLLGDLYRDLHRNSTALPGSGTAEERHRALLAGWAGEDPHEEVLRALDAGDPVAAENAVTRLITQASQLCSAEGPKGPHSGLPPGGTPGIDPPAAEPARGHPEPAEPTASQNAETRDR